LRCATSAPLLCAALFLGSSAQAATLHVPAEYPTIQAGIDSAVAGDSVLVAPGTYTETDTRIVYAEGGSALATCVAFLKDGVMLLSEAGPEETILDPAGGSFNIPGWAVWAGLHGSGETLLQGFTITGTPQRSSGARLVDCEVITIKDCVFRELDAGPDETGGGISAFYAPIDLVGCKFLNCRANQGGAIYTIVSNLRMEDCWVENCSSETGAIEGIGSDPGHSITILNSTFLKNAGVIGAGAVTVDGENYSDNLIQGCHFEENTSFVDAGAVGISADFACKVIDNVFVRNAQLGSTGDGGALSIGGFGLVVQHNTFCGNSQSEQDCGGSAVRVSSSSNLRMDNNLFVKNTGAQAVRLTGSIFIFSRTCNVFWDNPDGDICGLPLAETDRIIDPDFCDAENDDFTLSSASPCLPENSDGCGLIGALGQGCGTVSVESKSWGQIKGLYR
jgi:hypothetical protein